VRQRLLTRDHQLRATLDRRVHQAESRFTALAARLEGLSPLAVLTRGYAVCWDGMRTRVLRSAATVDAGDQVIVTLGEGEIDCTVQRSRPTSSREGGH
jgi:exodeoxyribonuclease VII large subunit